MEKPDTIDTNATTDTNGAAVERKPRTKRTLGQAVGAMLDSKRRALTKLVEREEAARKELLALTTERETMERELDQFARASGLASPNTLVQPVAEAE